MDYIDPHIHMISRVTDDYHRMAQCGCVAISEPAFWAGFDRGSAEGFRDYFHHLTEIELTGLTSQIRNIFAHDDTAALISFAPYRTGSAFLVKRA